MTWTIPRTWLAGEAPTAAILNEQIRDNFAAIGDAWTSYTPVWSAATTPPAIGNGSIVGAYLQAGKLVLYRFKITSGTTTTYGSGNYQVTLPVNAVSSATGMPFGDMICQQGSNFFPRTLMSIGSANIVSACSDAAVRWSSTNPFTPTAATAGQVYAGYGVYEAA